MSSDDVMNSMILEKGERILETWQGDVESIVKTVKSETGFIRTKHKIVEAKGKENGVLVLTNHRLVWLKKKGVFSKSYHITFEIALQKMTGISETGRISKRICVSDKTGEYRFKIGIQAKEFRGVVQEALTERKKALEAMRRRKRVHLVIDFSTIKDYMKKGGLQLSTIKCPECNAPLKMPKDGTEIVCQYCSSTVHAQDVFEKIKSLI